ncbi:MAG TPA: hypothetical protein VGI97_14995 [Gemmatimonadaceae bacterium]
MTFELKRLSAAALPRALERAEHYRLLNEPWAAESICLDILAVEPAHQEALKVLLLARCDQFAHDAGGAVQRAREALAELKGDYERAYYAGLILERRAKARLQLRAPGAGFVAYEWLREAMTWSEKAEALRPAGNDDAVLRWNTCARLLNESPSVRPRPEEPGHTIGE